jgi:hypothetical protein
MFEFIRHSLSSVSAGWHSPARGGATLRFHIQRAPPQKEAAVYGLPSLPFPSNSPSPAKDSAPRRLSLKLALQITRWFQSGPVASLAL